MCREGRTDAKVIYEAPRNVNAGQQKREARNVIHPVVEERSQYESEEHVRRNRKLSINGGNEESP